MTKSQIDQCRHILECLLLTQVGDAMVENLKNKENVLALALIIWLFDEMTTRLRHQSPMPDLLEDGAQSNFEIGCGALASACVLKREDRYWRIVTHPDDHFQLPSQFSRTDLDDLLNALACHSSYVDELYRHDEPVAPNEDKLLNVCRALVGCDYMEALPNGDFEWTDRIGPWFVQHYNWSLDEFEIAPQQEIDAALATIPSEAKKWLSSGIPGGHVDFVRCFFAKWIGGQWHADSWRQSPSDDWDLGLALGIYKHFHKT